MLFDLFKAFDLIESSHKSNYFSRRHIFLRTCATCSKLPFNINTIVEDTFCTSNNFCGCIEKLLDCLFYEAIHHLNMDKTSVIYSMYFNDDK